MFEEGETPTHDLSRIIRSLHPGVPTLHPGVPNIVSSLHPRAGSYTSPGGDMEVLKDYVMGRMLLDPTLK